MKRLLLAPLLIAGLQSPANSLPWSGDIVVKTDLGEKYTVKDSAVRVTPITRSDAIDVVDKNHPVAQCLSRTPHYGRDFCERSTVTAINLPRWKEHKASISTSTIEIPVIWVNFRAIFTNWNKQKIAGNYVKVACVNPAFKGPAYTAIDNYMYLYSFAPKENSLLATELLKAKVCDKYAKF